LEKREKGCTHISDDVAIYHRKLELLEREKWKLQIEKQCLNDQVQEQKKEYYNAASQQAQELVVLALAPEHGSIPEEVATLRKLVRLHEEKKAVVFEECGKLQQEMIFYRDWYHWNVQAIRAICVEKERMDPEL